MGVGEGVVSFFFTGLALVAEVRFASAVFGVADSAAGSGGVFVADFFAGGVFFAIAGLGLSELRVLMLSKLNRFGIETLNLKP